MQINRKRLLAILVAAVLPLALVPATAGAITTLNYEVVADGLDNPRHLTVGPDGALYVAEAGSGGEDCHDLVIEDEEGEFEMTLCFGDSGGITRIDPDTGESERWISGLPSYFAEPDPDDPVEGIGAHDISFAPDGTPYVVLGLGAGPDERDAIGEVAQWFGHVIELDVDEGTFSSVADLAEWEGEHDPDAEFGGHVDSNPYALLAEEDGILVADAGGNSLLHITYEGEISLVAVFPPQMVDVPPFLGAPPGAQMPMESVPTDLVRGPDGALYVSELTGFPFQLYAGNVYRIEDTSDADLEVYKSGFTMATALDFNGDDLFVTEFAREGVFVADFAGGLTRARAIGNNQRIVAPGLVFPTGVAVGPDGMVYVVNQGILPSAAVVRFDPSLTGDAAIQAACAPDEITAWPDFTDVEVSPHEEAIGCLTFWDIVAGIDAATFGRGETLTRGQMASIVAQLVDATDAELPSDPPDAFVDDDGTAHEGNINRLAAAGIVGGRTADEFAPGLAVTRAQLTTMLVAAYEYVTGEELDPGDMTFTDIGGTTHEAAIQAAASAGWVRGFGDGTFRPNRPVTREQAASMAARMLSSVVDAGAAVIPGS